MKVPMTTIEKISMDVNLNDTKTYEEIRETYTAINKLLSVGFKLTGVTGGTSTMCMDFERQVNSKEQVVVICKRT